MNNRLFNRIRRHCQGLRRPAVLLGFDFSHARTEPRPACLALVNGILLIATLVAIANHLASRNRPLRLVGDVEIILLSVKKVLLPTHQYFLKSNCLTICMMTPIPPQEMACTFSLSSNSEQQKTQAALEDTRRERLNAWRNLFDASLALAQNEKNAGNLITACEILIEAGQAMEAVSVDLGFLY